MAGRYRRGVLGSIDVPGLQRVELTQLSSSLHKANWSPDGQSIVCLDYKAVDQVISPALTTVALAHPDQPIEQTLFRRESQHLHCSFRQVSWGAASPSLGPSEP